MLITLICFIRLLVLELEDLKVKKIQHYSFIWKLFSESSVCANYKMQGTTTYDAAHKSFWHTFSSAINLNHLKISTIISCNLSYSIQ